MRPLKFIIKGSSCKNKSQLFVNHWLFNSCLKPSRVRGQQQVLALTCVFGVKSNRTGGSFFLRLLFAFQGKIKSASNESGFYFSVYRKTASYCARRKVPSV